MSFIVSRALSHQGNTPLANLLIQHRNCHITLIHKPAHTVAIRLQQNPIPQRKRHLPLARTVHLHPRLGEIILQERIPRPAVLRTRNRHAAGGSTRELPRAEAILAVERPRDAGVKLDVAVVGGFEGGLCAANGELVAQDDVALFFALGGGGAEADFDLVVGEAVGDDGAVVGDGGGVGPGGAAGARGGEGDELGGLGGGCLPRDEGGCGGEEGEEEGGEGLHFLCLFGLVG